MRRQRRQGGRRFVVRVLLLGAVAAEVLAGCATTGVNKGDLNFFSKSDEV